MHEIPTHDIEQATQLLALPACDPAAYDVLIYFSHRIPDPDGAKPESPTQRQDAFTAAVNDFLVTGGGMIAFHHGAYQDPARGVPAASYPLFNNVPDERYPFYDYNPGAGTTQTLFGSDYADNGAAHLLGFTHRRSTWSGIVVAYQPAEYQPHALDDLEGNNFQILANAILYAADSRRRNDVALTIDRGLGPNDVTLAWSGGEPVDAVSRSTDPLEVTGRCARIGTALVPTWTDTPPAADLVFYQVAGP